MGPIIRIVLRYGIGAVASWLVAKGALPEGLASEITSSDQVLDSVMLGVCGGAAVCTEVFWRVAKKNGWDL